MNPLITPLFPLNESMFKKYLKQITDICRELSNEAERASVSPCTPVFPMLGESTLDKEIGLAQRRNAAFIIKQEVMRKQHEREEELAALEAEAAERRAALMEIARAEAAAKAAADKAAGIENMFDADMLDDEPLDDLMRAIMDVDGKPLILKFLTEDDKAMLHFINKDPFTDDGQGSFQVRGPLHASYLQRCGARR